MGTMLSMGPSSLCSWHGLHAEYHRMPVSLHAAGAGGRAGGGAERWRGRAAGLLPQRPSGAAPRFTQQPLCRPCRARPDRVGIVPARLTCATCAQYGNMLLHTSAPRSLSASRLGAATAHAVALADRAVRGGSPPPRGAGSAWGGSPRGWSPEPAG